MVHWPRRHEMHSSAWDFGQKDQRQFYKLSVPRLLLLQLLVSKLYDVSFYVAQQASICIISFLDNEHRV